MKGSAVRVRASASGFQAVSLVVVVLDLLGIDVVGWLSDLWAEIKDVPPGYIVAGLIFQSGQTIVAGLFLQSVQPRSRLLRLPPAAPGSDSATRSSAGEG